MQLCRNLQARVRVLPAEMGSDSSRYLPSLLLSGKAFY